MDHPAMYLYFAHIVWSQVASPFYVRKNIEEVKEETAKEKNNILQLPTPTYT